MGMATTKKSRTFAAIAKSVLRMAALLWARKGGALKRANNRWLKAAGKGHSVDRVHYGERQLSFDETPAFHFKMHRPASMRLLACVNPSVDFDDCDRSDYFKWSKEDDDDDDDNGKIVEKEVVINDESELVCKDKGLVEEEIDTKAEEFITKFYAQMKMQRQISLLQYYEMLERSCG